MKVIRWSAAAILFACLVLAVVWNPSNAAMASGPMGCSAIDWNISGYGFKFYRCTDSNTGAVCYIIPSNFSASISCVAK